MNASRAIYVDEQVYERLRREGKQANLRTVNNILRRLLNMPLSQTRRGPKPRGSA